MQRPAYILRHKAIATIRSAAQRIYCAILLCGSESRALRKAPFIRRVELYTKPVLGKRHWGCGGLEPLRSLGSPTGFGDFCHQKSRGGSDGSAAGGGCSDLSEWQQLGDWRVSGANDDRAVVATGSGVATTRGWMIAPHYVLCGMQRAASPTTLSPP